MDKSEELTPENEKTSSNEDIISKNNNERPERIKHRPSKKKKWRHSEYDALAECRKMFRMEMMQLGKELFQFRQMCQQEISKYKDLLNKANNEERDQDNNIETKNGYSTMLGGTSVEQYWKTKLDNLQADMTYLEKKQAQLDREQQLVDKEDELSQRLVSLENYEQEIEELESVLDKRQTRCLKRQQSIQDVEEELEQQREELENNRQRLDEAQEKSDPSTTARKHWEVAKRGILEKQSVLESTVQKYRAELASASSNITGKDILISKLDEQVKSLNEQLEQKDKKIKNLESRLVLVIDECRKTASKNDNSGLSDSVHSTPSRRPDSRQSESINSDLSLSRSASYRGTNSSRHPLRRSDGLVRMDSASVRHPMRLSVDNGEDRFQMVKSPLPDKSSACSVM
ncbi:tropomyosin alpha-1 chain-like isoform X2 [Ostrea edulis]|uniref:tropomyosin alpha-1 chain-like isoform X2 n=1 Tax=Ostrea edulis TaxID=37623 RepID=UPI0024AFD2CA|nr:tropomyosin alpha-1 chain-like isoform X2 [Ostrea edulis]